MQDTVTDIRDIIGSWVSNYSVTCCYRILTPKLDGLKQQAFYFLIIHVLGFAWLSGSPAGLIWGLMRLQ